MKKPFECWGVIYTFDHGSECLERAIRSDQKDMADRLASTEPHKLRVCRLVEVSDDEAKMLADYRSVEESQRPETPWWNYRYLFGRNPDDHATQAQHEKEQQQKQYGEGIDKNLQAVAAEMGKLYIQALKQEERKDMPYDAMGTPPFTVHEYDSRKGKPFIDINSEADKFFKAETVKVVAWMNEEIGSVRFFQASNATPPEGWKRVRVEFT